MSKTLFIFLSVAVLGTSFVGCAVDECEKHADRPECQATTPDTGPGGILTLSPRRVNIKGDTVMVTMSSKTSAADDVWITQPGMADVSLGKLGSGMVKVPPLTPSQFSLGRAYLVVGKNVPEPIRFYLAPSYMRAMPDIVTGNETPLWAGVVANGTIVSLNDIGSGQPSVHYAEYGYQSKQIAFVGGVNYPSSAKGSATALQKYVGYPNGYDRNKAILLRSCNPGSDNCGNIQTGNLLLTDMSVNQKGTVLAAILDGRINVYFIDIVFGAKSPSFLINEIASPKLISSEDFDGDGLADLLVWNNINMNVLRQAKSGTTTNFVFDSGLSEQITAAIGADKPSALFANDIDGDGLVDIIYTSGNQLTWLANSSETTTKFIKGGALGTVSGSIDSLAVGDVDADSKSDLVIASKSDKNIKIYINQATY